MKDDILIVYSYIASLGIFIPFLTRYLRPYFNIVFKNISKINIRYLDKYICIIPTDVPSTEFYNNLSISKFNNKHKNIYKILDNKRICTKLVSKYKEVEHIPTLYNFSKNSIKKFIKRNPENKFIFKLNNGEGSLEQSIVSRSSITNINFDKYSSYILQPYITDYYIYSFDAIVKKGVIISELYSKILKKNGIRFIDFFTSIKCKILDANDKHYSNIKSFCHKVLFDIKYSGFIEFEFLVTKNYIYFLEINPRMCGHISQVDNNYNCIYFNKIIIPYLGMNNIYIPKHIIVSNITTGTNPILTLIFFYYNYKYSITLIIIFLIIGFLLGYYKIY